MYKKTAVILVYLIIAIAGFSQVEMQNTGDGILFTEKGENIIFYQVKPKSLNGQSARCNYFHPLWSIDGQVITEDSPPDHLHHHGIFWAWHRVLIGEKPIGDPWDVKDFEQEITDVEFFSRANGTGVLTTEVFWKSPLWQKAGAKVPYIRESTTVTIHPQTGNFRRFDFEIKIYALEENLKIGGSNDEKGYGGFSVRLKLPENVVYSGKIGVLKPLNTPVESLDWVNITGRFSNETKTFGLAIIDHDQNPGYPQQWILRKEKSMQNVVFPGNKLSQIGINTPLVLRYSLVVHNGKLKTRKIDSLSKTISKY